MRHWSSIEKNGEGLSSYKAFTLAEVLIALAISGIVAVVTIPTLIVNSQANANIQKLRKTKAVTEQMFKMMMVTDGVEQLSKTSIWALMGGEYCYISEITSIPACKDFFNAFKNYAKVEIGTNGREFFNLGSSSKSLSSGGLILPDGTTLFDLTLFQTAHAKTAAECNDLKKLGGSMCSSIGDVNIDVNGLNGPNVVGRDIFSYKISDEGRLYSYYGKDYALWYTISYWREPLATNPWYWRNDSRYCGTPGKKDAVEKGAHGWGCAARIEENDWKIDY